MRKEPLPPFLLTVPLFLRLPTDCLIGLLLIVNRLLNPLKFLFERIKLLPQRIVGNVLHGDISIDRHGGGHAC